MNRRFLHGPQVLLAVVACAGMHCVHAATITWGTPVNIAGDSDVSTTGTPVYAYAWIGTSQAVNGVSFTGTTNTGAGGADISLFNFGYNTNQYTSSANPFHSLSAAYQSILTGGDFNIFGDQASVTLQNLIVGHTYQVQVWVCDPRPVNGRTGTITGGNTVTMLYSVNNVAGSPGQYTIGTFIADGTSQSFTMSSNGSTQINAIQLRDNTIFHAISMTPVPGTTVTTPTNVTVGVNISPDGTMVNASSVQLIRAGPDGIFGTTDDVAIIPSGIVTNGNSIILNLNGSALPIDRYQLTLHGVYDFTHTLLDGEFSGTFPSGDGAPGGDFVATFNIGTIPSELVAWWKFDDGSGTVAHDYTGNGHDGTLINSPAWIQGVSGGALSFNGTNYVEVPYSPALNTVTYTISAYANVTGGNNTNRSLITSRDSPPTNGYSIYVLDYNQWSDWTGNSTSNWNILNGNAPTGNWVLQTATFDGTTMTFYQDGVLVNSAAASYSPNTQRPLRIGAGTTEHAPTYFFVGQIDDVRVYNRALSAGEVQALTIQGPKPPTLSWPNPANIVYGTSLGVTQLNATANTTGTFSYTPAAGKVFGPGTQTLSVQFTPADTTNYSSATTTAVLIVTPAPLTVTADNKTIAYGAALPALTASYSGFVNGDTAASLATPATLTAPAGIGSAAGAYPIIPAGAAGSNYTITFVNGTLTITPVALTVTADNQTKAYGAALPALTASYSGFVNGDTAANLAAPVTLTTSATSGSTAGQYSITASGAASPNYTIAFAGGTLSVTPVPLRVTADDKNTIYGAPNPPLTASFTGFVNGDTQNSLATLPAFTTAATTGSAAGTYPIIPSAAASPNYIISFAPGALIVGKALLSISADDKTKTYGTPNPALTASFNGFVNGEGPGNLSSPLVLSTTATDGSAAGSYPISASGAASPNYFVAFANASLSVLPAPLSVTADDQSRLFGADNPTLTATFSGFVNGDTAASLATPTSISSLATPASQPGTYPIFVAGSSSPNYFVSFNNGTLTVQPLPVAPLISSGPTASAVQGQPFSYTLSASGTAPISFTAAGLPSGLNITGSAIAGTTQAVGAAQIVLTANNAAGTDTQVLLLVIAPAPGVTLPVPAFVSPPQLPPTIAAGQPITLTAAAAQNGSTLAYTWDFGDGTTGIGPSVSHVYTTAGIFQATVTISDGLHTTTQVVDVPVNAMALSSTELAVFTARKASLKFNFVTHNDLLTFNGTIPVPVGGTVANDPVVLVVGVTEHDLTLDSKGKSADRTFVLKAKIKSGKFAVSPSNFMVTLKNQNLYDGLKDYGFSNADVKKPGTTVSVPVVISIGQISYAATMKFNYTAKAGKTGGGVSK